MRTCTRLGLVVIAMATTACDWGPQYCEGDWAAAPPETAPPRPRAQTVAQVLPTEASAVDMLFVIDDSRSMMDEQAQLGIWASNLFDVLATAGELPDLHIAVTSSSVAIPGNAQCGTGTGGSFHVGGAGLQRERYLRDVAGPSGRERNYTGTLTETFAMMAHVGDRGCGFEQPFKAARIALSNASERFLRDDALLLVVFVTDEDDCSARDVALFGEPRADACSELGAATSYRCFEHGVRCYDGKGSRAFGERRACLPDESSRYVESVADFAKFVKGLKPNPAQVVVAAIYGKPSYVAAIRDDRITTHETPRLADVCRRGGEEGTGATPAIRINAFLAEFGGRASQTSICEGELAWAMRDIGLVTRGAATRSHCLRGPLHDTDLATPGIQPVCRVRATGRGGTIILPPCGGADGERCFTLETDATCVGTELGLHVSERAADETLTVDCDVESDT